MSSRSSVPAGYGLLSLHRFEFDGVRYEVALKPTCTEHAMLVHSAADAADTVHDLVALLRALKLPCFVGIRRIEAAKPLDLPEWAAIAAQLEQQKMQG